MGRSASRGHRARRGARRPAAVRHGDGGAEPARPAHARRLGRAAARGRRARPDRAPRPAGGGLRRRDGHHLRLRTARLPGRADLGHADRQLLHGHDDRSPGRRLHRPGDRPDEHVVGVGPARPAFADARRRARVRRLDAGAAGLDRGHPRPPRLRRGAAAARGGRRERAQQRAAARDRARPARRARAQHQPHERPGLDRAAPAGHPSRAGAPGAGGDQARVRRGADRAARRARGAAPPGLSRARAHARARGGPDRAGRGRGAGDRDRRSRANRARCPRAWSSPRTASARRR